jgi:hypothetical protein
VAYNEVTVQGLLIEGMLFANYKQLATALGEEPKSGKSRELQLERWSKAFAWRKRGNKIIITEIFEGPDTQTLISRLSLLSLYKLLIMVSVYPQILKDSEISKAENQNFNNPGILAGVERRKLLYWLGIINKDCFERMVQKKEDAVEKEFFQALRSKNFYTILVALEQLQQDKVLHVSKSYMVQKQGEFTLYPSEVMETVQIDAAYREILNSYGYMSMQEVFLKKTSKTFYKELGQVLKVKHGILFHEESYTFGGVPEYMLQYLRSMEGFDLCKIEIQKYLNSKSAARMKLWAQAQWRNYVETKDIVFSKDWKNKQLPDDFVNKIEDFIGRYIYTETFSLENQNG